MLPPPYIPEEIRNFVEKRIVKAILQPNKFNPILAPTSKLLLIYGRPGSGMNRAVFELTQEHHITFEELLITRDTDTLKKNVQILSAIEKLPRLLIVRDAHFIPYHRDGSVQDVLCNLENINIPFIIVISEDPPSDEKHPFWNQFEHRICMPLPPKDYNRQLLEFYINQWNNVFWHKKNTIDVDFQWLANCTSYCTPRDIRNWCHMIFDYIRDHEEEEDKKITQDYLSDFDNLLLFKPFGTDSVPCITKEDGSLIQKLYDPSCVGSLINQSQSEVAKRSRHSESSGFLSGDE